jgi:hypothetical protein
MELFMKYLSIITVQNLCLFLQKAYLSDNPSMAS